MTSLIYAESNEFIWMFNWFILPAHCVLNWVFQTKSCILTTKANMSWIVSSRSQYKMRLPLSLPPVFDNLGALPLAPWLEKLGLHFSSFEQSVVTALRTIVPLSNVLTYEDKTQEIIVVKTYAHPITRSRDCSRKTRLGVSDGLCDNLRAC